MAQGNYDNAAPFYDRLSRMVFGKALINAQVYLLKYIPPNSTLLIVGGGTGYILDEITKQHPAGLKITYVEISAKMMALSQRRNYGRNEVNFINKPVQEAALSQTFDVVMTPFLLDNFSDKTLPLIFDPIHRSLKKGGLWLYTDFRLTGKLWQNLMLKSMLLFFKILCGVESWRLPNSAELFIRRGYSVTDEKSFYGNFIISRAYQK